MRALVIAAVLAACGPPPPPRDVVTPGALEHQDPKADTSHHPSTRVGGGSWWSGLHLWPSSPPDPFAQAGAPPHYYTGCGGCTADDPSIGALLVVLVAWGMRRRRRC